MTDIMAVQEDGEAGYSLTTQLLDQGADQKRISIAVATSFQAGYEAVSEAFWFLSLSLD